MFEFCIVIETVGGQSLTKWLSARNMASAREQVEKALTVHAIESNNEPVQDVRVIFDLQNFSTASRR